MQDGLNKDGTKHCVTEKVQGGSTERQASLMLSIKFMPTGTNGQGMSHS